APTFPIELLGREPMAWWPGPGTIPQRRDQLAALLAPAPLAMPVELLGEKNPVFIIGALAPLPSPRPGMPVSLLPVAPAVLPDALQRRCSDAREGMLPASPAVSTLDVALFAAGSQWPTELFGRKLTRPSELLSSLPALTTKNLLFYADQVPVSLLGRPALRIV